MKIAELQGRALEGSVSVLGQIGWGGGWPAELEVSVDGIRLEERVVAETGEASGFAGRITGRANWVDPLAEATTQAGGGGNLRLEEGRLGSLPVVGQLVEVVRVSLGQGERKDRAEVRFRLAGDRVVLESIFMTAGALGVQGNGYLWFSGHLDVVVRAGPLERITQQLGGIGQTISKTLGFLPRYRITGDLGKPRITLANPLAKPKEESPGATVDGE